MAHIFDGVTFAQKKLQQLKERVAQLSYQPRLISIVHAEDTMGMIYTRLKAQAASEAGIDFQQIQVTFAQPIEEVLAILRSCQQDPLLTGLLIQKPTRKQFDLFARAHQMAYDTWWAHLATAIEPRLDVDCLTPINLRKVYAGERLFLPATARAVATILTEAVGEKWWQGRKVAIVGRSDLVSRPLAAYIARQDGTVRLLGRNDDLQSLFDDDIVVSATGRPNLIDANMIKPNSIVVDVGEPKGDVFFQSVSKKVAFITPVPGGVGPVTVVCLLENLLDLPVV